MILSKTFNIGMKHCARRTGNCLLIPTSSHNASGHRYIGHNFNQPITVDRSCFAITAMHNDRIHLKARWTIKYMLKY